MRSLAYGMGMRMYEMDYPGTFALGHIGGAQGFFSHLPYFPDREVVVTYS